jgi:hypothetical protein
VNSSLQEVKILKTWVQNPPSIKGREITDFIPSGVHPRELDLMFLNNINFKKLQKELLEQKLLLLEYKTTTEAKLEEAEVREENLIKSNEDFKNEMKLKQEEMQKQQEETNLMLKQMMDMLKKQAKP